MFNHIRTKIICEKNIWKCPYFFFQNEVPTIFIIMKRLAFYVDLLKLFIQLIKCDD